MDRIEFATLKIYQYVDELFTAISDLLHPEIESALNEKSDLMHKSKHTFYGLTSGAIEEYRELQSKHNNA